MHLLYWSGDNTECKHYTNVFWPDGCLPMPKLFPPCLQSAGLKCQPLHEGCQNTKYRAVYFKEERAMWHRARKARRIAEWTSKRPIHVRSYRYVICPCLASSSQPFYLLVLKKVNPSLPFSNSGKSPRKKKSSIQATEHSGVPGRPPIPAFPQIRKSVFN